MRSFFYTANTLLLRSFPYTPNLVKRSYYTPGAGFSEEFPLHSCCKFQCGVSFTPLMLVLVMGLSYTPDASFSEEFLLHSFSWF